MGGHECTLCNEFVKIIDIKTIYYYYIYFIILYTQRKLHVDIVSLYVYIYYLRSLFTKPTMIINARLHEGCAFHLYDNRANRNRTRFPVRLLLAIARTWWIQPMVGGGKATGQRRRPRTSSRGQTTMGLLTSKRCPSVFRRGWGE